MTNDEINQQLGRKLRQFGLSPLENQIIDRDGRTMDLSGVLWKFNAPTRRESFNWETIQDGNSVVEYSLRRWVQQLVKQQSANAAVFALRSVIFALRGGGHSNLESERVLRSWQAMAGDKHPAELADALRAHVSAAIEHLRARKRMQEFYCLRDWYRRSSDVLSCLGFDEEYALELDQIHVPGRESGIAVELEDEESGPLWDVEVSVLQHAILDDHSSEREHVMQRAAAALGLAFGRNPSNYCLLREEDLKNALAGFEVPPQWVLSIPRIKKPGIGPRAAFIDERVDERLVQIIQDLIESNRVIKCGQSPRPLFMRSTPDPWFDETGVSEYKYHLPIDVYRNLLSRFVDRLNLKSPRTNERLFITPRRLRYTFATTMVERGVARRTLAAMLDHSDTQHVQVYYSLKGKRLTRILDRAAALRLGPLMKLFKGRIVESAADSTNGEKPEKTVTFLGAEHVVDPVDIGGCGKKKSCQLDPPFTCYCCPQFEPFVEADHDAVLTELLATREERRKKYSLQIAIQLDDVIYAVCEVIMEVAAYVRRKGTQT
ncbi:site-specific integrase [Paraburkholderia pallida]|uniref:Site-specific integrase n=1 Tax=Paraburkholderia pallida TaxID=2547399 RepID=A0A4P7CJV5_9BURK|nr:site-specific integrase [Paraburkholderia pallida]QBQ95928.1 site-specific integrase [Paraburkholderia pallida]